MRHTRTVSQGAGCAATIGFAYSSRMWQLGDAWQAEAELARDWRAAQPFPHLVFDGFLPPAQLPALMALLEEEPVERYAADIFAFEASAPEPATAELAELRAELARVVGPPLGRITGRTLRRADMRAYAYRAGHYLLPHSDHQDGLGRELAYVYYLPSPEPPTGGELELFACRDDDGELVSIETAKLVEPVANRLIVFEVSPLSLHQVREVLAGLRISLAGWFYP
jgi:Rps23 Pro-64 3,4-dihydroxylase Tpa1-like proline 4-hydroxylase